MVRAVQRERWLLMVASRENGETQTIVSKASEATLTTASQRLL